MIEDSVADGRKPKPYGWLKSWSSKPPVAPIKGFAIVDFGSHKMACAVIAETGQTRHPGSTGPILGSSVVRAAGCAQGRISNLAAAETSLRNAIAKAEAEAGVRVAQAIFTGSFQGLWTDIFNARVAGLHGILSQVDQEAIFSAAYQHAADHKRQLAHVFARPPSIEPLQTGTDQDLAGEVASTTFPLAVARQFVRAGAQAQVHVTEFIAAAVASGLAITSLEERRNGIAVVDMGASSTGVAFFSQCIPVYVESLPFGGRDITRAIAEAFSLKPFAAERLKVRHATSLKGLIADRDLPFQNEKTGEAVSKAHVNRLVQHEASSQFVAVKERLNRAGYSIEGYGAVLTGGASQLPGCAELAAEIFRGPVRLGSFDAPYRLKTDPSMAALCGAYRFVSQHQCREEIALPSPHASQGSSYAARIGGWLRTSF